MNQLFLKNDYDQHTWNSGAASFYIDYKSNMGTLPIAVTCRFGSLNDDYHALFDTGASYSVIGGEIVELLEKDLGSPTGQLRMDTRFGILDGELRRLKIHLLADPGLGYDLTIESTVLIAKDWVRPPLMVLGFHGFMDRLRFAIDPGIEPNNEIIYFGKAD